MPITNDPVGAEEQDRADRRLIERAGVEEAWHGRLRGLEITRRQVNLSHAPIGQGDVDLHKQQDAGEPAFLAKPGLGPFGSGDLAPNNALLLGERAPAGGDRAKSPADRDLGRGAGIGRDEGRIAILAIPVALPNRTTALARLRNLEDFHN